MAMVTANANPCCDAVRPAAREDRRCRSAMGRGSVDVNALIAEAAHDFSDYQQLTAAGKLAEAGKKLEELKRTLEELQSRSH